MNTDHIGAVGLSLGIDVLNRINPDTQNIKTEEGSDDFQVMLITQFLRPLFENTSEALFGDGVSADLYKTKFAQALAENIADGRGLGLAKMIGIQANANNRDT